MATTEWFSPFRLLLRSLLPISLACLTRVFFTRVRPSCRLVWIAPLLGSAWSLLLDLSFWLGCHFESSSFMCHIVYYFVGCVYMWFGSPCYLYMMYYYGDVWWCMYIYILWSGFVVLWLMFSICMYITLFLKWSESTIVCIS